MPTTQSDNQPTPSALADLIKTNADVLADLAGNNIDTFIQSQEGMAVKLEATFLASRQPPWEATLTTHWTSPAWGAPDFNSEPIGTGRADGRTLREAVSMAVGGFTTTGRTTR